ncbi:transmembrane protein 260 [Biomphalaria glabrata]|nr:transmembrane protein 260 [Biomphalaria glabrata]
MFSAPSSLVVGFVVFVSSLVLYVVRLHPSLPGGDSGELIAAAHELGVAHPPGYPLFTLLAKLFIILIPGTSVAWKVNLLSAFCAALNSAVLYLLVHRLTLSNGAALFASTVFSFSPLVCVWSLAAEVFSLNNLLLSSLIFSAVVFDSSDKDTAAKVSLKGSFLCGLCLTNQHTSVLYILPIIPWVLYTLWKLKLLSAQLLVKQGLLFALGLSPYLYIPVSSWLHLARWTWGDSRTLEGFLIHLLRVEYGTWDLLKDHIGQGFLTGIIAYINHITADLSLFVLLLAVLSLISIYSRYKVNKSNVLVVLMLSLLLYVVFFCWRANLDLSNPLFYKVVERFWIQSDLILVILASVSFADVCRFISAKLNVSQLSLESILVWPLVISYIVQGWAWSDQSNNFIIHDFAIQTLEKFPKDSIILTKGDLPSNTFRYFHLCENVRPDLSLFDQEVLTYEWSLPMMRQFWPKIKFPGDFMHLYTGVIKNGKRSFTFKDLIDANYKSHPIFACIGMQNHEPSWKSAYVLWPYGVCFQLVDKDKELDIATWTNYTADLASAWTYPLNSLNDGSWENVASSEMWRAKTVTALFYLEEALEHQENSPEYLQLLQESYRLYTKEFSAHGIVPSYWHRNYAIVCERLIHVHTQLDHTLLLNKTIHHFNQFLEMEPGDVDADNIRKAVTSLESYRSSLSQAHH